MGRLNKLSSPVVVAIPGAAVGGTVGAVVKVFIERWLKTRLGA